MGAMTTPVDASYLADVIVLLRFFEAGGRIRKAISVVKHRSAAHENMIRELSLSTAGIHIGEPLDEFSGVLTGVPAYSGGSGALEHKAHP
jgi:circadian clock protein KaiC